MPSSAYFRRQADICLRLSLIASDHEVSNRLITMSREYLAKSDAMARDADTEASHMDDEPGLPDESDTDNAGLRSSLPRQSSRVDP